MALTPGNPIITGGRKWRGKVEGRAVCQVVLRPQMAAVRFYDRTTDRQSYAEPLGFGCKERFKNFTDFVSPQPRTAVTHRDKNPFWRYVVGGECASSEERDDDQRDPLRHLTH